MALLLEKCCESQKLIFIFYAKRKIESWKDFLCSDPEGFVAQIFTNGKAGSRFLVKKNSRRKNFY